MAKTKKGRDEFPQHVKDDVAARAGHRCSKPDCPAVTIGPKLGPAGTINTGEAAHIYAAASGGPRPHPTMSEDERRSLANAIWLCRTHHTVVDRDDSPHPASLLYQWKILAEDRARRALLEPARALQELAAHLVELPGVKTPHQLLSLITRQFYTRDTAALISQFLQGPEGRKITGMAAKLALEHWETDPTTAGLLITVVDTNLDTWTPNKSVTKKLRTLCNKSISDTDCAKIGAIEPAAYALAAKGDQAAFRMFLKGIVGSSPFRSADVARVDFYYGNQMRQFQAYLRHALDSKKVGILRVNNVGRLIHILHQAGLEGAKPFRREIVRLIRECQQAASQNEESDLAAWIQSEIEPYILDL